MTSGMAVRLRIVLIIREYTFNDMDINEFTLTSSHSASDPSGQVPNPP
jgi:hypothetical protein